MLRATTDPEGVVFLRLARTVAGRPLYRGGAYLLGNVLLDCGPPGHRARACSRGSAERTVDALLVTHHHEDHSGARRCCSRGGAWSRTSTPPVSRRWRAAIRRSCTAGWSGADPLPSRPARWHPSWTRAPSGWRWSRRRATARTTSASTTARADGCSRATCSWGSGSATCGTTRTSSRPSPPCVPRRPCRWRACSARTAARSGTVRRRCGRRLDHLVTVRDQARDLLAQGLPDAEVARRAVGPEGPLTWISGGRFSALNFVKSLKR